MRIFGGWVMTWLTVASASAGADDALFVENDKLRGILLPRQVVAADNTAQNDAAPSRESLFDDDKTPASKAPASNARLWRGYSQGELSYTYADPKHWSNILVRTEVAAQGTASETVKWKLGARLDYDAVYDLTDFYPSDVRKDQRFDFLLRENYVDIGAGDWDFRLGRQQVVWGEMVGLYFADVVTAKDLRQFILPDFEILRIPQWTLRAEYFKDDVHAELIWIPVPSYDLIGKPGAEFFPAAPPPPPGFATQYDAEQTPERTLAHTNYGARLSWLHNGWDMSGFYYGSMDSSASYYRRIDFAPQPTYIYQARHDRIQQYGGTLAKDFGDFVFKAEAVYTHGRKFSVLREDDADGVVPQNTLDAVVGLDFALPEDTRLNVQLFQRTYFHHDPDIIPDRNESGYSLLLNHKFSERFEGEVLWISSFNRNDWMLRPKLAWRLDKNWRVQAGLDIFGGGPLGLFGQFNNRDRVHTEIRYDF